MKFLSPRSDIVFKKLFGTVANKDVLISFLNSITKRGDGDRIVDVEFNDPSNHLETLRQKFSIVDVRCRDEKGNQYILEMQNQSYHNFVKRAQFYVACGLSGQLKVSEDYAKILPVIFVGIVDFVLFARHTRFESHHAYLDTKDFVQDLAASEYHFIELSKFNKKEHELESEMDKWVYFLKNAENEETIPAALKSSQPFQAAYHVLMQSAWTPREIELYRQQVDALRVERGVLETAELKGEQRGRVEGRAEGRVEGRAEGVIATARNMLAKGLDVELIKSVTGLDADVIKGLKK